MGPVIVGLAAAYSQDFVFYKGGILTYCGDNHLNIDITTVLVGMDLRDGGDGGYYRVRFAWGSDFGDNGHVKLGTKITDGYGVCSIGFSSFDRIATWD